MGCVYLRQHDCDCDSDCGRGCDCDCDCGDISGWVGKRGNYDVLPLVLQWGKDDPVYLELPSDLVLRVKLRHPKYVTYQLCHTYSFLSTY